MTREIGGTLPVYCGAEYSGSGNPYLRFYRAQLGPGMSVYQARGLPVLQGYGYQRGSGLGDILRGVIRSVIPFLAPIASRAASGFISNTARGLHSGQSLKDAAKGALRPTAEGAVEAVAEEVGKRFLQRGHGHKRKKVYKGMKVKKLKKHKKTKKRKPNKVRRHSHKHPKLHFKTNF